MNEIKRDVMNVISSNLIPGSLWNPCNLRKVLPRNRVSWTRNRSG